MFGLDDKIDYVYFIQIGDKGPIKIGHTKRLRHRLCCIQVDNPFLIRLLAVELGGFKRENELHKLFESHRLIGEWFLPYQDLIGHINTLPKLDLISADFRKPTKRGPDHFNWKGDNVLRSSKRQRGKIRAKRNKYCFYCKCKIKINKNGPDLVFIDGNPDNLNETNLAFSCRRCRMQRDGTLENLLQQPKRPIKPPKPCTICSNIVRGIVKGRCHACNEYFRRNGKERSEMRVGPKSSVPCCICNKQVKYPAKGKCHSCYEFFRRRGFDRNEFNIDDNKLNILTNGLNKENIKLVCDLYNSGRYSVDFLAKKINISKPYLYEILSDNLKKSKKKSRTVTPLCKR